ncbi:MAG: LytTR family DNA-binding domain-containing protein [Pseudomonadota bacterium]|nr:LytTR family DNA-binding domain-containing protein [Pseudomonadota bacterium]
MSLRVLIADDEPLARDGVALYLTGSGVQIVAQCDNGLQAVKCIRELQPDLVFLDINMPGLNGIEVVQEVGPEQMPLTIFLTAHDKYAIDAFRINALDYLLKPINAEHFAASLRRAREELDKRRLHQHKQQLADLLRTLGGASESTRPEPGANRILVRSAGHVYFLKPQDIAWIEADGDYVSIHAGSKTHLVRETLKTMEERLGNEGFQRIHRSSLVNLDAIRELIANDNGDYQVVLKDDTVLKLSRNYRDQLYARLNAD